MSVLRSDVTAYAITLGKLDSADTALMTRLDNTADMLILKTQAYLGYDDLPSNLTHVLSEMSLTQLNRYADLQNKQYDTNRVTRGDYTVQYDTNVKSDIFSDYEWILKKYKKLRTL